MNDSTPSAARILLAALALTAASAQAAQQQVWRCGNSYQQQPCPEGEAVQAPPAPTASERARHDAEVARQAKAADALEKSRLQAERQASRDAQKQRAANPALTPEDSVEPNGGQVFRARVPLEPKAKKAAKAAKPGASAGKKA